MSDLHELSALDQAAAIRSKQISAVELAEHYLARTEALDESVGAFVVRTPGLALGTARLVDEKVRAGNELDVLAGTVVPVKDLEHLKGVRCRAGSAAIDTVSDRDDHVVTQMKRAHLVITGKTNAPEFGCPCYTESAVAPPARTPWDLHRSAGGSSGGAAAAVATGLASAAQGSDGGGSIRIPASVTGLVGLKPTRGRVSNGPLPDDLGELAHYGPLARTVADAAALLDVMVGRFDDDMLAPAASSWNGTFLDATKRDPATLRIARYCVPVLAETVVDPRCLAAYEEASELLLELGHIVEDVDPPFGPDEVAGFEGVWAAAALSVPVPADAEDQLMPLTRWLRDRARGMSALDLATSLSTMRTVAKRTIASTAAFDVVLTPTLAELPALVGGLRNDDDPSADFEAQKRFTPWTSPYNMSGQPAISLPLSWPEVDGYVLPVGIQLIGRPGGEATLLALSAQIERARPWSHRRPPAW